MVWTSIIILIVLISLSLRLISSCRSNEFHHVSAVFISFGAFCLQGTNEHISRPSSRCVIIFLLIASLLIHNFYTSVLVSILVEVDYKTNVTNLNELADSDIEIGILNTTVVKNLMKMTTDENAKAFLSKRFYNSSRDRNLFFMDAYEGFKRVRRGHFAFYCEEPIARFVAPKLFHPHEICNINKISFQSNDLAGIIVRKHSPFRERFLINWLRFYEAGITNKILKHWNPRGPRCVSKSHFESVRLEYILPILICLVSIQCATVIIVLIENAIQKRNLPRTRVFTTNAELMY